MAVVNALCQDSRSPAGTSTAGPVPIQVDKSLDLSASALRYATQHAADAFTHFTDEALRSLPLLLWDFLAAESFSWAVLAVDHTRGGQPNVDVDFFRLDVEVRALQRFWYVEMSELRRLVTADFQTRIQAGIAWEALPGTPDTSSLDLQLCSLEQVYDALSFEHVDAEFTALISSPPTSGS